MGLFFRAMFLFVQFTFLLTIVGVCDTQSVLDPRSLYSPKRRQHPVKWGKWSQWGACSRTCGEGVTKRSRDCKVWDGHRYRSTYAMLCSGSEVSYRMCRMPSCPPRSLDYRQWQCETAGDRRSLTSDPSSVMWIPTAGKRPCDLRCKNSLGWTHSFGNALDGTRCYRNANLSHVCIQGRCQSVGCDGIIGSRATLDVCGKCSKRGVKTTCFLIAAKYHQPVADNSSELEGYNFIITVPKGATYLYVKETTSNLIALQDETGTFIINGQGRQSKNGVYTVGGMDFRYKQSRLGPETLESDGPLVREATIMLVMRERNPGVYYHFWQPEAGPATLPFGSTYIFTPPQTMAPTYPPLPTTVPTTTTTTTVATTTRRRPRVQERPDVSDDHIWDLVLERLQGENELQVPPYDDRYGNRGRPDTSASFGTDNRLGGIDQFGTNRLDEDRSEGTGSSRGWDRDQFGNENRSGDTDGSSISGGPNKNVHLGVNGRASGTDLSRIGEVSDSKSQPSVHGQAGGNVPGQIGRSVKVDTGKDSQSGRSKTLAPPDDDRRVETMTENPLLANVTETPVCGMCRKMKNRVFHFCDSDFVTQMMVNGKRYVGGQTRYDVTIMKSYKARMQLLSREYLWAPNLCNCPRLRVRKSYVIMGFMQRHLDREFKLIITPAAYVRRYSAKQHKRMLKLQDLVKCEHAFERNP